MWFPPRRPEPLPGRNTLPTTVPLHAVSTAQRTSAPTNPRTSARRFCHKYWSGARASRFAQRGIAQRGRGCSGGDRYIGIDGHSGGVAAGRSLTLTPDAKCACLLGKFAGSLFRLGLTSCIRFLLCVFSFIFWIFPFFAVAKKISLSCIRQQFDTSNKQTLVHFFVVW